MKKLTILMAVLVLSVFLVGCNTTCPEIPEYECPDCICPDVCVETSCPACPDIPACPNIPACPEAPDCVCPDIPPCALAGILVAEDFGWADFSKVIGYTAGFGLIDATIADVHSIVVKLYSGETLLQTNTATPKVVADLATFTSFSGPFDVFGTFDYVTDGYWVNVREVEYGQTIAATKVVATVTLINGKVVTAENINPTNMP